MPPLFMDLMALSEKDSGFAALGSGYLAIYNSRASSRISLNNRWSLFLITLSRSRMLMLIEHIEYPYSFIDFAISAISLLCTNIYRLYYKNKTHKKIYQAPRFSVQMYRLIAHYALLPLYHVAYRVFPHTPRKRNQEELERLVKSI